MGEEEKPASTTWQYEGFVSGLGQWAWLLVILNGILEIFFALWALIPILQWNALYPMLPISPFLPIWYIIWGVIIILVALAIIKPKFSNKCAAKDWDALFNWVLPLGSFRMPWMLLWGIIIEIFSWWYWGGLPILIPALLLLFAGPKKYEWSTK